MKTLKFCFFCFLLFSLLILSNSCKKEYLGEEPIIDEWDTCTNYVAKSLDFRLGEWERQEGSNMSEPSKIEFTTDSTLNMFNSYSNEWGTDVKYQFLNCHQFDFDRYWDTAAANGPFQNWASFLSYYNEEKEEWYLVLPDSYTSGEFDTLILKKQ